MNSEIVSNWTQNFGDNPTKTQKTHFAPGRDRLFLQKRTGLIFHEQALSCSFDVTDFIL